MTVVPLNLSGRLDGHSLCVLIQRFVQDCGDNLCNEAEINFAGLTFVTPAGVTFLSNFIFWLASHSVRVRLTGLDRGQAAVKYLDDSGFFEKHAGRRLSPTASCRSTTLPLCTVNSNAAHHWVDAEMGPWMAQTLGLPRASIYPIEASISEIFNNIKDHSSELIGSVCAQHFPRKDELTICIADFGKGIPTAVKSVLPDIGTDAQCIVKAVERGFTTRSTPNNAGQGLDYLLASTVTALGATVMIRSLKGHVLFHNVNGALMHRVHNVAGFCPGTIIDITLKTDSILTQEGEAEDLTW